MLPAWTKRARPRGRGHVCSFETQAKSTAHPYRRLSTTAPLNFTSVTPSTIPSAPERILIIGCGISGLSVAHYLQRLARPSHIPRPHLRLVDSQPRSGGWIDTQLPTAACPHLFERGPRSLLTRRGDSTLALIQQLRLHQHIVPADVAAKRRYVWDSSRRRLVLLPTGVNTSLFRFPLLGPVVRGAWHEVRTPAAELEDESVADFITRRFNRTVAEELIDPLAAGIYTGSIEQLSLRSCFPVLHTAEQQSGSVVRHLFGGPRAAVQWLEGEEAVQAEEWARAVKRTGTYSFSGGMRMLTDRLTEQVEATQSEGNEERLTRLGANVEQLVLSDAGVTAVVDGVEERYDRVISTVSAKALSRILARSVASSQPSAVSSSPLHTQPSTPTTADVSPPALQLVKSNSSASSTDLLASLSTSLSSLPYANVWVVNLAYPSSVLATPAFGLLCASHHSADGLLGIAFDSCVFPQHSAAHPLAQPGATRLTVMLGGARFPHLAHASSATAQSAAMAAVRDKLGVSAEPLWVQAQLAVDCIPQYVVGHGRWRQGVEDGLEQLNARLAGGDKRRRRLDVLGNAMYGVSVNDLIHRAKLFATQYYRGHVDMAADAANSGSEAGILPVSAPT